ncbi:YifB family Mg chelatase-like AAA ATPase [Sessilibacter sp. MAH4]
MSLAVVLTRAQHGVNAPQVTVEVHLSSGLPSLNIVGLPETAVKESKERVRSALLNSHFEFPARRVTINLAPADLPKEGGRYDLAIALGILVASDQLPAQCIADAEFYGELALSGEIRPIRGIIPAAITCLEAGRSLYGSQKNEQELALIEGLNCFAVDNLLNLCALLKQQIQWPKPKAERYASEVSHLDLSEVKGQHQAKRALLVAAAGRHNLLYFGPPGTGKTLLAKRLPGIMPSLTSSEALKVAAVYSVAGMNHHLWQQPPLRSPHNSSSMAAMVGGGSNPKPGEISLAHLGVLFLDEFPEFPRQVLEVLREPLESGQINIARANHRVTYPANFQLIAAMNPCPCGYLHSERCRCTPDQVRKYRQKISGPILDRIDLQIAVSTLKPSELHQQDSGMGSKEARACVVKARARQIDRQGKPNAELSNKELERICILSREQMTRLENAIQKMQLSARAYHRTLKVARTIADLADSDNIENQHIMEALSYRQLERQKSS